MAAILAVVAIIILAYNNGKKAAEVKHNELVLRKTVETREREQEIANRPASNDVDELIDRLR